MSPTPTARSRAPKSTLIPFNPDKKAWGTHTLGFKAPQQIGRLVARVLGKTTVQQARPARRNRNHSSTMLKRQDDYRPPSTHSNVDKVTLPGQYNHEHFVVPICMSVSTIGSHRPWISPSLTSSCSLALCTPGSTQSLDRLYSPSPQSL